MIALLRFLLAMVTAPFEPMWRLEAENAALRQQLITLLRKVKGRPRLTSGDRWFLVVLYQCFPSKLGVVPTANSIRLEYDRLCLLGFPGLTAGVSHPPGHKASVGCSPAAVSSAWAGAVFWRGFLRLRRQRQPATDRDHR
jgi:hypothetical protein